MAFGFPAYHTEECPLRGSEARLRDAVLDALAHLGWKVKEETATAIRASTSLSLWSYGERVLIRFRNDGGITATSKCALVTQCFDWGKNKRNVRKLLAEIERRF